MWQLGRQRYYKGITASAMSEENETAGFQLELSVTNKEAQSALTIVCTFVQCWQST